MKDRVLKQFENQSRFIGIIMICLLLITMEANTLMANSQRITKYSPNKTVPLLLNSKLADSTLATVKVIIWFDNSNLRIDHLSKPPLKNWTWSSKYSQAGNGSRALTISGEGIVNKIQELQVYTWYTIMVPQIAKEGGRIYFDERIPEGLDISAYLNYIKAQPVQWTLSNNLISIAAYEQHLNPSVKVGKDSLNLQVLSRGTAGKGETVLAIPVLLEEF
ncbi:YwmB family TATA-box binding protein [Desulfosporosinus sp. FKA]|uniref:YwmB family TATA-box binding protein n=1 Tax=Desulfosporosinus sp. FKA TaxID=1969834 RepID=UPI000B49C50E|nr:YwmB family TATA-box binding protein [Desulfosporosinus sp. FKA]